jgi:hypothetical protein
VNVPGSAGWLGLFLACLIPMQEPALVVRPGPPALDDLESDADGDGIPDGWYNLRDATHEASGGVVGPACLRFTNAKPGRPARASRAFGIDGRTTEALVIGLWVKVEAIAHGERIGEEPGLLIDFLDESLRAVGRGQMGPWTVSRIGEGRWLRVAKRIPVPPESRDALLSVGLIGAIGTLWVDGLSIEMVPVGGSETTNLVLNGDLELGEAEPAHWLAQAGARRVSPGRDSGAGLELARSGARAQAAIAVPVQRLGELDVRCAARGSGLRGSGGAQAVVYFLGERGETLPGAAGSIRLLRFAGTFAWQEFAATARVPAGAARAVIQFEKTDGQGSLRLDDLVVTARPDPARARWTPYHAATDTSGWPAFEPAGPIEPGSALDASTLLDAPAGKHGFVMVRDGRLAFQKGGRARFHGAVLLPPLAVIEPERADALADDLARRGVNLVHLAELDAPYGPGRSLIDDTADDTSTLDPDARTRLDHLLAALKTRGIYVTLDLNAARLLRSEDRVPGGTALPPGGGPAAGFDPALAGVILKYAGNLLDHVNPETGLALKDEPALAWIGLAGERSLFDLIDEPDALPGESAAVLRAIGESRNAGAGRRLWQVVEAEQWRGLADALRKRGVKVPIAGSAHWRREPEFVAAQAARGLDLIDDRLYWGPPLYVLPERLGLPWAADGGLVADAGKKRRGDRPYVVSQWCARTEGLWALPHEGADLLLAAERAAAGDWDALVRRGVFLYPESWGASAPGTTGGGDLFPIVEVLNANPAAFAMLPHAASLMLRDAAARGGGRANPRRLAWDPATGRLAIDSPHTQALAIGLDSRPARFAALAIDGRTPGAVVAVSSFGREPIAEAKRLLVTAVGRVEPTGMTYADACRTEPGQPGRPPLLCEPVRADVTWTRGGTIKAYALDNAGRRAAEVPLETTAAGARLVLDGRAPGLHWELVAE